MECALVNATAIEPLASASLLAGVEVLELSSGVAGAYAGRLLATMGARVRRFGPALEFTASVDATPGVERWLHEGKEVSSAKTRPSAAEVTANAQLIIAEVDPVDPDFLAWVAEVTSHANSQPRCPVVVTIRAGAFEDVHVVGTGLTSSAWSGISWSIGDADKAPLTLPFNLADYQAATHACAAGLSALLADPVDSALRAVDVAGRDVLAYYTGMITANFIPYERPWTRDGARPPGSAGVYPASIFACADGHVVFMCRSQREWDILLNAMGSPAWSQDPRFADPRVVARLHADEADQHLIPWIARQTKQELLEFGQLNGLPIAPVRSVRDALDEPQLAHREFLTELPGATGPIRVPTQPWQLSQPPATASGAGRRAWPLDPERPTRAVNLLDGLRVLDLSWVWSGPLTTSILADMGAEVLKVEHTGHMDTGRHRGKARRNGVEVEGPEHEATPYFNQMNHGKRSLTLDLKQPRAREILLQLVEHCDVVVENMRPGVLDRLGIGYADLAARNPAVVMMSMSMAGQSGPLKGMKGYAGIMAAMSGLESLIGYDEDNIVGSLAPALGDPNAAGHAMSVLFAALYRRRVTGRGAWIDLSQIEALMSVLTAPIIESQLPSGVEVPANRHPRFVPHGHFPCRGQDKWIAIAVRRDSEWAALVGLAAEDILAAREDWRDGPKRVVARAEVELALSDWTITQDRDALVEALIERGVAAAPVGSYEDLMASPWKADRNLTVTVEHRYLGETEVFTVPWKFGGETPGAAQPAPLLGADTEDVLGQLLTMPADEIRDLQDAAVLY
jgi:crotonobetainyl-CoA:carnitine CoA-transferase CaiB-like acyl-CoA transferase